MTLSYFPKLLQHYNRFDVQVEMAKQCINREFSMLYAKYTQNKEGYRGMIFHRDKDIKFHMADKTMKEQEKPLNFYYSLATFKKGEGVPYLQELHAIKEQWKSTFTEHMATYDLLIDVDPKGQSTTMDAHENATDVKTVLDKWQCPYSLRFSGGGFHFVIPWSVFNDPHFKPFDDQSIYRRYYRIAKYLYDNTSELIDTDIYDARRICKLPYSIACEEDKGLICWPFSSDEEFLTFKPEDYDIMTFNKPIAYRGIPLFNNNKTPTQEMIEL